MLQRWCHKADLTQVSHTHQHIYLLNTIGDQSWREPLIFPLVLVTRSPLSGVSHDNYQARWFERCEDRVSGEQVHIYKGGYWETKDRGGWDGCPDIF